MPNGKPGDHPIGDYYLHGHGTFPPDACQMLDELKRRVDEAEQDGRLVLAWDEELREAWAWTQPQSDQALDQLRAILRSRLDG